MEALKQTLLNEIPRFKEQGEAFLNGELNKMGFKRISGGFGVYAHRNAKEFMIRLRILSGVLSKDQLKLVASWASKYAVPIIHFTTRQAIQYHGISLDDICKIMEEGIAHNIYTRGAGGNFPRNVAMSPLSGVDPDESFDVVPYAMAANAYFLQRINTYHLPRKLKVSFSSSDADTSNATVQDLGFVATCHEGKPYFTVYIGGGMGRDSRVGIKVPELLPVQDALYAIEAMVELFKAKGDYENHQKARIRYIPGNMGDEEFVACFKSYLDKAREEGHLDFDAAQPKYEKKGSAIDISHIAIKSQKQPGLYSYYFHPVGGQLDVDILNKINEVIAPMQDVYGRLSMDEGMYLINLTGEEAKKVAEVLDDHNHLVSVGKSRSCIGVPICQMGILESQKALRNIVSCFEANHYTKETLPQIGISGCGNSCGTHEIAGIGLMGKRKKVGDQVKGVYDVYVDGCCQVGASQLGRHIGEVVEDQVGEAMLALARAIDESQKDFYTFIDENEEAVKQLLAKYCS